MKVAAVGDLQTRYTSILKWIEAGEEIVLTQRGKAIARLVPEVEMSSDSNSVDWSKSPAVLRDRSSTKVLTMAEASEIVQDAGGQW